MERLDENEQPRREVETEVKQFVEDVVVAKPRGREIFAVEAEVATAGGPVSNEMAPVSRPAQVRPSFASEPGAVDI